MSKRVPPPPLDIPTSPPSWANDPPDDFGNRIKLPSPPTRKGEKRATPGDAVEWERHISPVAAEKAVLEVITDDESNSMAQASTMETLEFMDANESPVDSVVSSIDEQSPEIEDKNPSPYISDSDTEAADGKQRSAAEELSGDMFLDDSDSGSERNASFRRHGAKTDAVYASKPMASDSVGDLTGDNASNITNHMAESILESKKGQHQSQKPSISHEEYREYINMKEEIVRERLQMEDRMAQQRMLLEKELDQERIQMERQMAQQRKQIDQEREQLEEQMIQQRKQMEEKIEHESIQMEKQAAQRCKQMTEKIDQERIQIEQQTAQKCKQLEEQTNQQCKQMEEQMAQKCKHMGEQADEQCAEKKEKVDQERKQVSQQREQIEQERNRFDQERREMEEKIGQQRNELDEERKQIIQERMEVDQERKQIDHQRIEVDQECKQMEEQTAQERKQMEEQINQTRQLIAQERKELEEEMAQERKQITQERKQLEEEIEQDRICMEEKTIQKCKELEEQIDQERRQMEAQTASLQHTIAELKTQDVAFTDKITACVDADKDTKTHHGQEADMKSSIPLPSPPPSSPSLSKLGLSSATSHPAQTPIAEIRETFIDFFYECQSASPMEIPGLFITLIKCNIFRIATPLCCFINLFLLVQTHMEKETWTQANSLTRKHLLEHPVAELPWWELLVVIGSLTVTS